MYLSTTTSTGYRLAQDRYLGLVSGLSYFPLDWQPFSSLAWNRIDPDLSILTEGERWPEHMRQASLRKVPVLCINGRISDRSFGRLRSFPLAAGLMLGGINRLLASSAQDAERFTALGFPVERLAMTGNIKLDVSIPLIDSVRKQALRAELGLPGKGVIILGSSTWPGEEEASTGAPRGCISRFRLAFLIVPRHAERRNEIRKLLGGTEFRFHFRSGGPASGEVDVAVADTTGELGLLTQLAVLVMVGKSLAPHTQGQTPVEAAILGKPILCGPGMSNFRQITAELVSMGAARQLSGAVEIGEAAAQLLGDPSARGRMSEAGELWRRKNSGCGADLGGCSGGIGGQGRQGGLINWIFWELKGFRSSLSAKTVPLNSVGNCLNPPLHSDTRAFDLVGFHVRAEKSSKRSITLNSIKSRTLPWQSK